MMIQSINSLELGINMPHEKKAYVKIYKRKRKAVLIAGQRRRKRECTGKCEQWIMMFAL